MDNPQYILNEVNKGIKMGMDSILQFPKKLKITNLKMIYYFNMINTMKY